MPCDTHAHGWLQAVLYSQNLDSLQYPRLLELMKVDPWDVWRAIAPFMRVESTMPSALSRHLFYVEEQLLLEGGWKEHTLFVASLRDLASKIKAKEATMSEEERKVRGDVTLQDVMPIPVSVAMFLRKVSGVPGPLRGRACLIWFPLAGRWLSWQRLGLNGFAMLWGWKKLGPKLGRPLLTSSSALHSWWNCCKGATS